MKNNIKIFIVLITLMFTQSIAAQTTTEKNESPWMLRGGVFYTYNDSYFELNDIKIDFEDTLDLQEETFSPVFEGRYSFNNRHAVGFNFISLRRKGEIGFLTQEVEGPGGNGFLQAGASVVTAMDLDIYQFDYAYKFFESENWDLGLTAGLHMIGFSTEMEGGFGLKNEAGVIVEEPISTDTKSLTIPLPNIGLFAGYQIASNWEINARMQVLYLAIETFKGALFDTRVDVTYDVTDYFSIVAGINYDYVTFEDDLENATLEIAYSYIGPVLMAEFKF